MLHNIQRLTAVVKSAWHWDLGSTGTQTAISSKYCGLVLVWKCALLLLAKACICLLQN